MFLMRQQNSGGPDSPDAPAFPGRACAAGAASMLSPDRPKACPMERFEITADRAFLILARAGSETNTKLGGVAGRLVTSGGPPGQQAAR